MLGFDLPEWVVLFLAAIVSYYVVRMMHLFGNPAY